MNHFVSTLVLINLALSRSTEIHCPSLAHWMKCSPQSWKERPLNTLAIPGSHDTFAYRFLPYSENATSMFAPDNAEMVGMLEWYAWWNGQEYVRNIIGNWSITQSLDMVQQLDNGVRYFDIRTGWNPDTKQLHFLHSLWGEPAEPLLTRLANEYLPKHKGEVILLDFNHFYDMSLTDHTKFAKFLITTFGNRIAQRRKWRKSSNITLKGLIAAGEQVIILHHHLRKIQRVAKGAFWPGSSIPSPWPNTVILPRMYEHLEGTLRNHEIGGEYYDRSSFIVYQAVLTPTASTLIFNLGDETASLKSNLAEEATAYFVEQWMPKIVSHVLTNKSIPLPVDDYFDDFEVAVSRRRSLTSTTSTTTTTVPGRRHDYTRTLNVFIADFVETSNFTQVVIDLNELL